LICRIFFVQAGSLSQTLLLTENSRLNQTGIQLLFCDKKLATIFAKLAKKFAKNLATKFAKIFIFKPNHYPIVHQRSLDEVFGNPGEAI
jgi:hypothetical protein